jgi:hypothetical protein
MIISDRKKFIFIHLYKTAGTSVTNAFLPYGRFTERLFYGDGIWSKIVRRIGDKLGLNNTWSKTITGHHKHAPVKDVIAKIGEEKFKEYFSFGFVRNPFDLLVSLYSYILQDRYHFAHEKISKMSFKEFVEIEISGEPITQFQFMANATGSKIMVDYIGKFESLDEDILKIQEQLELGHTELVHKNP